MQKRRLILWLTLFSASIAGYAGLYYGLKFVHARTSVATAERVIDRFIARTSRAELAMSEFARSFGEDTTEVNFLRSASFVSGADKAFVGAEWLTVDNRKSLAPKFSTRRQTSDWTIPSEGLSLAIEHAMASNWTQTPNVFFTKKFRRSGVDVVATVCPVPQPDDPAKTNGFLVAYFRSKADLGSNARVSIRVHRLLQGENHLVYPTNDDGVGEPLFVKTIQQGPESYRLECRERKSYAAQRARIALLGLLLGPFSFCLLLRMELKQEAARLESYNKGLQDENAEQRELQRTLRSLLQMKEQERRLVSSDIHDGFVQEAISAQMFLEALATRIPCDEITNKQLTNAQRALEQAVREGRQLVSRTRVLACDEYGFLPAIQRLVSQQEDFGVKVLFRFPPDLPDPDIQLQREIYRIVQEALSNVRRHSNATEATVSITVDAKCIFVDVMDHGKGFELENVGDGSFGMRGIRERAELLGGEAQIKSEVGEGTVVQVCLPLRQDYEGPAADSLATPDLTLQISATPTHEAEQ